MGIIDRIKERRERKLLRPLDQDDKEALRDLIISISFSLADGTISKEEEDFIEDMALRLKNARLNSK